MQDADHFLNANGAPQGFERLHIKSSAIQSSLAFLPAGAIFNQRTMSCDVSGGGSVYVMLIIVRGLSIDQSTALP